METEIKGQLFEFGLFNVELSTLLVELPCELLHVVAFTFQLRFPSGTEYVNWNEVRNYVPFEIALDRFEPLRASTGFVDESVELSVFFEVPAESLVLDLDTR